MAVANTTLRNLVAGEGDSVTRTILSYPASSTYTPGTDISNITLSASSETLTIATWLASKVTVDDTEKRQSIIEIGRHIAQRMMRDHNNRIEQAVLGQVTNATTSIDDGNVGGTAGNNIALNTSVIPQVFTSVDTKLDALDVPKAGRLAVVGTHFLNILKLQQAARATSFGDQVNARGFVGRMFGYDIIYSNNLPYSATLGIASNPTSGDTVTIAGVVFTFVSTIGTAGYVKIGGSAAVSVDNLVLALNAPGTSVDATATAGSTAVATEDAFLLRDKRRIAAVDGGATIAVTGFGDIVVSETFVDGTDTWSAERQDSIFTLKGSINQIVQIPPKIEVVRDPDQFSDIVKSLLGYGVKTFADGAREMTRVKIDASTQDWS